MNTKATGQNVAGKQDSETDVKFQSGGDTVISWSKLIMKHWYHVPPNVMNWEGHHTFCTEILLKMFHLHLIRKRQSNTGHGAFYKLTCLDLSKCQWQERKRKMKETVLKYRRLKRLNQKQWWTLTRLQI